MNGLPDNGEANETIRFLFVLPDNILNGNELAGVESASEIKDSLSLVLEAKVADRIALYLFYSFPFFNSFYLVTAQ